MLFTRVYSAFWHSSCGAFFLQESTAQLTHSLYRNSGTHFLHEFLYKTHYKPSWSRWLNWKQFQPHYGCNRLFCVHATHVNPTLVSRVGLFSPKWKSQQFDVELVLERFLAEFPGRCFVEPCRKIYHKTNVNMPPSPRLHSIKLTGGGFNWQELRSISSLSFV